MFVNFSNIVCHAVRFVLTDYSNKHDIHYAMGRVDSAKNILIGSLYFDMTHEDIDSFNELCDELLNKKPD